MAPTRKIEDKRIKLTYFCFAGNYVQLQTLKITWWSYVKAEVYSRSIHLISLWSWERMMMTNVNNYDQSNIIWEFLNFESMMISKLDKLVMKLSICLTFPTLKSHPLMRGEENTFEVSSLKRTFVKNSFLT